MNAAHILKQAALDRWPVFDDLKRMALDAQHFASWNDCTAAHALGETIAEHLLDEGPDAAYYALEAQRDQLEDLGYAIAEEIGIDL